jgi:hypothetical protein
MAQNYGPVIVKDGLVLALDAADVNSYPGTGTTWRDVSGNNRNHNVSNTTFTTFQGVKCFNNSTTGFIIPISTTYTFTNSYTMLAWANPLSDGQVSTWRTLWRTTPDDHPILIRDGDDVIGYFDNNGAGFVSYGATLGGLGLANKWTMFTITGTGGSTSLYYNNATFVGTVGYTTSGNNHDAIGNVNGTSQPFGYIATAALYNRPLTTAEISQIYNQTKTRFGL